MQDAPRAGWERGEEADLAWEREGRGGDQSQPGLGEPMEKE